MSPAEDDEDEDGYLVADGLEAALIGLAYVSGIKRAVYSVEKVLAIFRERDGMTDDEDTGEDQAREFYEFNVIRAADYLGDRGPIFVEDMEPEALDSEPAPPETEASPV